jgi:hypothetical protein
LRLAPIGCGAHVGNKIAMFDTKEEKITEYPLPTKFTAPYDVIWFTPRVDRADPCANMGKLKGS